ncbi:MAG: peptidylprolyl isomerase [Melioribacteraceae bacterium]|nr:peptidylprolyl isomerase [Melioribacteraceae bacterium]
MRLSFVSFLLIGLIALLASCTPEHSKIVVAEYGDYKITMDEFEKAYAQNVGGIENAKKDSVQNLEKFLDLYTKFKMKLRDASVRGFDKEEDLQSEFLDYKNRIGSSYIKEKKVIEPGLKEIYEKRKNEVRVAHILIRQDTISKEQAKEKAKEYLNKILAGEDWNEACKKYSEDNSSKNFGGDVYYITGGVIFPELEDAIFSLKADEVYKEPVPSRFGFHLLKASEIIPRKEKISAQHILIKSDFPIEKTDSSALAKMYEALAKIKAGTDFGEVAKEYSDDPGSGKNGGELGAFERRMMVKPFDEAAFKLNEGEISDIVRTKFGYHVIKVNKIESQKSFNEERQKLSKMYEKVRYQYDLDKFIESLKSDVNFKLNNSGIEFVSSKLDSVTFGAYNEDNEKSGVKDTVLYSIAGKVYTADSLFNNPAVNKSSVQKLVNKENIENLIKQVSSDQILSAKAMILEKTDSDFAALMDEYKNGIYIFKLQEEEIWNRIAIDTLKLKEYYKLTKDNYRWEDRVDYHEVMVDTEVKAKEIYNKIKNEGAAINVIAAASTKRKGAQKNEGHFELVNADLNEVSKMAFKLNEGDLSEPIQIADDEWIILKINKKDAARVKTFEEAYAEISSSYQEIESDRLEKQYINKLESVYAPVLYKDELTKAYMSGSN